MNYSLVQIYESPYLRQAYNQGKREGLLEAYRDVLKKVDGDEKDNTVWREGNQYYDNVLDYCERKIKEFERWERK